MRILITGANGFVGKTLVSELSKSHGKLILLDRPGTLTDETALPDSAEFYGANIADPNSLEKIQIEDVDALIHAAGLAHQFGKVTKEDFWKINVEGTENVAKLAARLKVRHFIFISSVSVYGKGERGDSLRTEETPCCPEGFYAESKLESEFVAKRVCEENGIDLTILRLATVIGEGDAGNVSRLIRAVDRRRFYWIGGGANRKSLLYKRDVAKACMAVLEGGGRGTQIFNVSGEPATMREIVSFIEDALGKKAPPFGLPPGLVRAGFAVNSKTLGIGKIVRVGETVEKWLSDETFSAEKLKHVYGFEAQTSIREAIRREVEWYLEHK
jgi:nucleoside-diphosphate-sugar epimerase